MADPELRQFLDQLADAAAAAILPHFRTPMVVKNKGAAGFDPVTIADQAAETAMRRLIAERFPGHGVIGEELPPERPDAEHVWVLDPIDGTRAFIAGIPVWGTLIGLMSKGVPELGMMAQPFTGERFAGDGKTAWYTGPGGPRTLATASHGWGAIGTAPLWIITGSLLTGSVSRGPLRTVSRDGSEDTHARWAKVAMWARFPAGMPDGLDRAALRSREVTKGRR